MPTITTTKHANMLIETLKIDNCNRLNKKEPRKTEKKRKPIKKQLRIGTEFDLLIKDLSNEIKFIALRSNGDGQEA